MVALLKVVLCTLVVGAMSQRTAQTTFKNGPVITMPLPHEYVDINDIPETFTWANVSGVNYLTTNRSVVCVRVYSCNLLQRIVHDVDYRCQDYP